MIRLAEALYEVMAAEFLNTCKTVRNFNVGSRIRSIFEAVAATIEELSLAAYKEYLGLYAQTASGDILEKRAEELGLERKDETFAEGYVRFTGDGGTVVPEHTIVATDPTVEPVSEFETTEQVTLPGGGDDEEADVPVVAEVAGDVANRQPREVKELVSSVPGISAVVNVVAIAGGRAEETDQELRERLKLRWYQLSYGGTQRSLAATALEVAGVAEAVCVPLWAGPGTAKVLVWSRDSEGRLVPASSELVDTVQAYFGDTRRPLCCKLTVAAPTGTVVDVTVYVQADESTAWPTVVANVTNAATDYVVGVEAGGVVRVAGLLAAVMAAVGVADAKVAQPGANVGLESGSVASVGRMEVLPMDWDEGFGF